MALTLAAALVFVAVLTPAQSSADQAQPDVPLPPVVLITSYSDGRSTPSVVSARPTTAWTPLFPKTQAWRSPEGLTVSAIHYRCVLTADGVRVDVSVFLGEPHQKELPVAHVTVTADQPVVIDGLRDYGVAPVTLSTRALDPTTLYPPQFENKTAALQITDVEVTSDDAPAYRITVRNVSSKPVMTFHVESYQRSIRDLSGRQGLRDGTPAVQPGGTYTFRFSASSRAPRSQSWTPSSHDLVVITGLLFEDGEIEGDPAGVWLAPVTYLGRRAQLARVLELFAAAERSVAAPAAQVQTLTNRIEALPVLADAALRQSSAILVPSSGSFVDPRAIEGALSAALLEVRSGVLSDVRSAPREPDAFARWLTEIREQYRAGHQRFVALTSRPAP
jgi:hypothetical protein